MSDTTPNPQTPITPEDQANPLSDLPVIEASSGTAPVGGTPAQAHPSKARQLLDAVIPDVEDERPQGLSEDMDDEDAESALAYQSLMRHRKERRRKKIIRVCIVLGVIAAIAVFGLVRNLLSNAGGDAGEAAIPTEFVYRDDFRESISGTGNAKPLEQVTVAADLTGEVISVDVAVGDVVFKSQQLMTIKNDSLDTDADEAWFKYKEAEEAISLILKTDSVERCRALATAYADRAKAVISKIPDSVYRETLVNVVDYIVSRDR